MGNLQFQGVHADFLADETREIDLEGSLSSGKTTVALFKELQALLKWPGIWILLTRYSDDAVKTKLKPAFEEICAIENVDFSWNDKEKYYEIGESRAFAFGLKAASLVERYNKIRGLPVSRIYVDQAEELPSDIANELRARLRPDIRARLRGSQFPNQLTFSPNPTADDHWIAKQFPIDNHIKNRRYYALSLFDNEHNLPAETIEGMLQTYPAEHPKHGVVILGQRGLNVIGEPIYDGVFNRELHVKPTFHASDTPLWQSYQMGKHNPVWIVAQQSYHGGLQFLGGIIGQEMMLEDFLPIARRTRGEWFPQLDAKHLKSCSDPMGDKHSMEQQRFTLLNVLREGGESVQWRDNSNAPDVRLAMIEHLAGSLRRRTTSNEESLTINSDKTRWLKASRSEITHSPFLEYAFSGGYTWSEHFVSVSNKEIRQPHEDDWFANAMHAAENLVLNFCAGRVSDVERDRRLAMSRMRQQEAGAILSASPHAWMSY